MTGASQNETEIAEGLYPDLPGDAQLGKSLSTFAAAVNVGAYRDLGGSGGLVSWLAVELLKLKLVDAVLHVKPMNPTEADSRIFHYDISYTPEEVVQGARSRYYPVEMSGVLEMVRQSPKRYLVIGLPCFIKSIRLMQNAGVLSRETVPYCIGLICGHLKSRYFADYLAEQRGSGNRALASFDFRHKLPGRKASDYGFTYRTTDAPDETKGPWPMIDVRGKDWGEGQFKNQACEFCDDVLAECADIVIGDAWLPGFVADYRGTNIVVTRDRQLDAVVRQGQERGELTIDMIDGSAVIQSQSSSFRHRREGLAHRLARRKSAGIWAPVKRVAPKLAPGLGRRLIYDLRQKIADNSARMYAEVRAVGGTHEDYERRVKRYIIPYKMALRLSAMLERRMQQVRRTLGLAS